MKLRVIEETVRSNPSFGGEAASGRPWQGGLRFG